MSRLHFAGMAACVAVSLLAWSDTTAAETVVLTSVTPAPAATAISPAAHITLTFSQPMMPGMEQYVDLHRDGSEGPVVPMDCVWNGIRTALTCTPGSSLASGTHYTIHVGGGMADGQGRTVDLSHWTSMGGHWITGGMMGGMHDGQPVGMLGPGWTHRTHYGMVFSFTTA